MWLTTLWFGDNKDYAFVNIGSDIMVKKCSCIIYSKLRLQSRRNSSINRIQKRQDIGSISINNAIQKAANKNYGCDEYMKIGDTVYYKGDSREFKKCQ